MVSQGPSLIVTSSESEAFIMASFRKAWIKVLVLADQMLKPAYINFFTSRGTLKVISRSRWPLLKPRHWGLLEKNAPYIGGQNATLTK